MTDEPKRGSFELSTIGSFVALTCPECRQRFSLRIVEVPNDLTGVVCSDCYFGNLTGHADVDRFVRRPLTRSFDAPGLEWAARIWSAHEGAWAWIVKPAGVNFPPIMMSVEIFEKHYAVSSS